MRRYTSILPWLGAGLAGGLVVLLTMLLALPMPAFASTQTILTRPDSVSLTSSWPSQMNNFLGQEDARRYNLMFDGFVDSGGTHGTSETPTATISALVAFPGGWYVSAPATSRDYAASSRTFSYVYSHDGAAASDFALSGGSGCAFPAGSAFVNITGGGSFIFVTCALTSAPPTLTVTDSTRGIVSLMRVETSATAITGVLDRRNLLSVRPSSTRVAIHVAEYGALSDDGLNDDVNVQQALDAMSTSGNSEVLFDCGTYTLVADLVISRAGVLRGRGECTILSRTIPTTAGGYYGLDVRAHNVTIRDLRINIIIQAGSPATGYDVNAINAVSQFNGDNLTIDNVIAVATRGVNFSADSGFRAFGIFGPGGVGSGLFKLNPRVHSTRSENFNRAIEVSRARNVILTDNIILNMAEMAMAIQFDNGMQVSNNVVRWADAVTNPVTGITAFGIMATSNVGEEGLGDSSITGNTLINIERCVTLQGGVRILVANNVCRGRTSAGNTAMSLTAGGFLANQSNLIIGNQISNFTTGFGFVAGDGQNSFVWNMFPSTVGVPEVGNQGTNIIGPNIISDVLPGRRLLLGDPIDHSSPPPIWAEMGNLTGNVGILMGQSATRGLQMQWIYNAVAASAYALVQSWGGTNNLVLQRDGGGVSVGTATAPISTGGVSITGSQQLGSTDIAGLGAAPYATAPNFTVIGCTNCARGSVPCSGVSTGAMAKRENGAWNCD